MTGIGPWRRIPFNAFHSRARPSIVLMAAMAPRAIALDPGDNTPFGILQSDNATTPMGAWAHCLNGYYYLRSNVPHDPSTTWVLVPQLRPGPMDPVGAGGVQLIPLPHNGRAGEWAKIKATSPGWVRVQVFQHQVLVDDGQFCFYDAATVEDEIGNYMGYDPRYGGAHGSWMPQEGGYFSSDAVVQVEPAAEDLLKFDDRHHGHPLEWTGAPLAARSARVKPESQLLPLGDVSSLMANSRNLQTIRVWLRGPQENNVNIPGGVTIHGQP